MAVTGLRTFQPFTYSHWNPTVVLVIPLYLHYYNSSTLNRISELYRLKDIGVWRYLGFVIYRSIGCGWIYTWSGALLVLRASVLPFEMYTYRVHRVSDFRRTELQSKSTVLVCENSNDGLATWFQYSAYRYLMTGVQTVYSKQYSHFNRGHMQ